MSETDKEAIRIVKDLQKNIRNTTLALVSIFVLAILTAVFWGGGIDNQVDTNTKNINDLSTLVRDFVTEQRVNNENTATEKDVETIKEMIQKTSANLAHLSYWAKSKGYEGLPRGIKEDKK